MTTPLSLQRQSIEHLIALAERDDISDTILAAARSAALTLAWIERRQELISEVVRLDDAAPALALILKEFPGAKIVEVK